MIAEKSKELVSRLNDMNRMLEDCMYLLQNAFIYNSSKSLDACEAKAKEIHENEKIFTQEVIAEVTADPQLRVYVSVPGHIERMGDYVEDIIGCFRTKIRDGVLFTDKAVSEITFLTERVREVLKNTSDIILARNRIIRDYIKESSAEISRTANEFSTMHEERLIEGLCTPKASPLFLDIMDALKGIAWHAKEIAEKLTP